MDDDLVEGTPYGSTPAFQRPRDRAYRRAAEAAAISPVRPVEIAVWLLAALLLLGGGGLSIAAISAETGLRGVLEGLALAALPVIPVVATFRWLDRFENEPSALLAFAFAWGAGVATLGALILNAASVQALQQSGGDTTLAAVLIAPVIEEALKAGAVVLIFLVNRREFDGVIDGIVYAGLAGVGFAFVENVLYLGRTVDHGGSTAAVFLLRCLASPFAHPLFTAATGIGLGIAARTRHGSVRLLAPVAGFAVAVLLHSVWNLSATSGLRGFIAVYLVVQVPLFAGFAALAIGARRREGRIIAARLGVYAAAGWLTTDEVTMLSSLAARQRAQLWASSTGRRAGWAMRRFQGTASELAFLRERMTRGTAPDDARNLEQQLLNDLVVQRRAFLPG